MRFHKSLFPRSMWKALNISVILAMIVASFAPVIAMAATDTPSRVVQTNGACEVDASSKIFLPLISSAGGTVASTIQRLLSNSEIASNPQVVDRILKYQVGKTYIYSYDVTVLSKSSQRNKEGTSSSDKSKTVMAAQAELSITSQGADGTFEGQLVMTTPYVCSADLQNGTDSVADTADLSTELEKPIFFTQKPNGEITSVTYPTTSRAAVVNMQKGVINALQNILQDGATYAVAEVGGQGTFTPTYTLQEQADTINITKDYNDKSFSKLEKQGDDIKSLKLTSVISAVLDGPKGVFASVISSEVLETGDGSSEPNATVDENGNPIVDGTTTWSTVNSSGKLSLKDVKVSNNLQAASLSDAYVVGGLEPIFEEPAANPQGIDLTKVDLNKEFDDFEADPASPTNFSHILDLVSADTGEAVVDKIIERLNANANNEPIASSYIDLLTVIATPKAQTVLSSLLNPSIKAAGISATMSITTQEHALIDLVRVESPISTTVDTISQLSADKTSQLQSTAVSVLGAAINNLSDEDPQQAQQLADGLVNSLSSASLADKQIYLDALGNAGLPSTLDAISEYTNITGSLAIEAASLFEDTPIAGTTPVTEVIEAAAYNALRKIPGLQAEGLLTAALGDDTQPVGTRLLVADILKNRTDLSGAGSASLDAFNSLAGSGTFSRYWGSWLGNSNLGIYFPGSFTASNVGQYYLYADQQANGYVWGRSFQAARGQLVSYTYQPNPSWQFVGGYLDLAGNRVVQREAWILCNQGYNGNLWASNWRWSYRVSIPIVWVITIDVDVKVTVNVNLDYSYGLNICTPNNASMYGEIKPGANVVVVAEASLNLRLARGGVGIYAKVMDTTLPARLSLSFDGSNFRLCPNVRVVTNPLSGYIYAFADVGIDYWLGAYWKRVWSGNLATFNVGTYSYNVFTTCW